MKTTFIYNARILPSVCDNVQDYSMCVIVSWSELILQKTTVIYFILRMYYYLFSDIIVGSVLDFCGRHSSSRYYWFVDGSHHDHPVNRLTITASTSSPTSKPLVWPSTIIALFMFIRSYCDNNDRDLILPSNNCRCVDVRLFDICIRIAAWVCCSERILSEGNPTNAAQ